MGRTIFNWFLVAWKGERDHRLVLRGADPAWLGKGSELFVQVLQRDGQREHRSLPLLQQWATQAQQQHPRLQIHWQLDHAFLRPASKLRKAQQTTVHVQNIRIHQVKASLWPQLLIDSVQSETLLQTTNEHPQGSHQWEHAQPKNLEANIVWDVRLAQGT